MKRDLELIRSILLIAENGGDRRELGDAYSLGQIKQHLEWMVEAKLIRPLDEKNLTVATARPTWQGLEFLANARDEDTWRKVMHCCADSSFGVVSSMLNELALRKARARV